MNKHFDEWISKIDLFVHYFTVFYKSVFEEEFMPEEVQSLSLLELGILNLLEREQNLSIKNIIDLLNVPNSTLTSAIDRLEKKKIVCRNINPADKRTFILTLSDQGKVVNKKRIECRNVLFKFLLLGLDNDNEREMLIRLLEKITGKIKNSKNIKEKM